MEKLDFIKEKSTKEKILDALEGKEFCVMCGEILPYNPYSETVEHMPDLNEWGRNNDDIGNQAKLLMKMGFEPTDKFCPDCFWK